MPLENEKPEIVGLLSKYVSQIKTSISQVTGSASIKMPQYLEPDDEKAIANKETIDDYENYLVSIFKFFDVFLKFIFNFFIH